MFYSQRNWYYLFVFSMIRLIITKTITCNYSHSLWLEGSSTFLTASMCVVQTVRFHCGLKILLKLHKLSDELVYEQIATGSPSCTTPTALPSGATRTPNRGDCPVLGSLSPGSLILWINKYTYKHRLIFSAKNGFQVNLSKIIPLQVVACVSLF